MSKTVLSFYLDDTNPYDAPAEAFRTFLDFCASQGVKGESSVILGYRWETHGLLSRPNTHEQSAYLEQLRRAYDCGMDSHMELMTHQGLFDFDRERIPADAVHEGLWLHEPDISLDAYESYFDRIIEEAARADLQLTGVTWPGCECTACERRYAELRKSESFGINPNVWKALLSMAQRNRFRGRTVPCFTFSGSDRKPALMAGAGSYGVWDLMPNADDMLGSYTNSPDRADPAYYIAAEGQSGKIVELVRGGAPYCLFYAHWQGLNPANGAGWQAFTQVIRRVHRHLGDQIEWLRPSEYTDRLCAS